MNIGISLTGISHLINSYRPYPRSYKICYENFFTVIYNPLNINNNVTTYITTYNSTELDNIIKIYNPRKHQTFDFISSHQIITFIKSLEQLRKESLDIIICTRFDISFNSELFKKSNFDLTKFNFLFREEGYWENNKFVNDCFYLFPFYMLENVINACYNLLNNPPRPGLMDMHGLYSCLEKQITAEKINFVSDEYMLSHENKFYTLKRL